MSDNKKLTGTMMLDSDGAKAFNTESGEFWVMGNKDLMENLSAALWQDHGPHKCGPYLEINIGYFLREEYS